MEERMLVPMISSLAMTVETVERHTSSHKDARE